MGEQSLDELRVKGPPGALSRLRNEDFLDSQKIYNAALGVIDTMSSSEDENPFTLTSSNGAVLTYNYIRHRGGRMRSDSVNREVAIDIPFPSGRQRFALKYIQMPDERTGSPARAIAITRKTSHGRKVYEEVGVVYDTEAIYHETVNKGLDLTSFDGLQKSSSVIDPGYIEKVIVRNFPQLAPAK